jgi:hypothetical protein
VAATSLYVSTHMYVCRYELLFLYIFLPLSPSLSLSVPIPLSLSLCPSIHPSIHPSINLHLSPRPSQEPNLPHRQIQNNIFVPPKHLQHRPRTSIPHANTPRRRARQNHWSPLQTCDPSYAFSFCVFAAAPLETSIHVPDAHRPVHAAWDPIRTHAFSVVHVHINVHNYRPFSNFCQLHTCIFRRAYMHKKCEHQMDRNVFESSGSYL